MTEHLDAAERTEEIAFRCAWHWMQSPPIPEAEARERWAAWPDAIKTTWRRCAGAVSPIVEETLATAYKDGGADWEKLFVRTDEAR